MLYDSYVNQVKKAARIKDKIIKYKLPIFIVIGAIFAFLIFFVSTKGIVLSDVKIPNHFVYGEDITPKSSAMFSGVSFEYRAVGEELWSNDVPTTPGEYEVRATSKRAFGGKGHSNPQSFVIEPLNCDVNATSQSIIYGENPDVGASSLLKGHHIECTSFIYDDVSLNTTSVKPDLKYTHIYDETGADVTDCYNLNAISSDITFNKRSLEITIDSSTKIYDGMILKNDQYQITSGSLAFDDRIEIVIEKYIINAGKIDNISSSYRILNGTKESTINYDVKIIPGYLQIDKRPIVITSDNQTITYDGNTHSSTYTYSGNLITGHSFEFVSNTTVINVGTYANNIKLRIVDSEGNDVTSNYELSYVFGKIEILKRDLHVKMLNQTKVYDNLALTSSAYELQDGELVENHDISIIGLASIIDVGSVSNSANVKINSNGLDVTANYNIIIEEGTLEVTPRAISIKPCDISTVYDGEYHGPNDFEYTNPNITLFDGESFVLSYSEAYKYADTYKSRIESYKILRNNKEDITNNYDVTVSEGDIEILVRPVSVKPEDIEAIYDHELHQASNFEYLEGSYELIPNDGITFIYSDGYINVGDYESRIVKINFQNEDARNSYEITTLPGSIKILKRDIKVKPEDLEITYDSFDHVSNEAAIENINDHELFGKIKVSIKTDGIVNEYTEVPVINSITDCVIYYDEEEITDNFNIILNTGTLNVLKRPLKVIVESASKVYDNKILTLNEYTLEGEIASNDEISSIVIEGEILDVGKVENTIKEFRIIKSNTSHEVTPSYDITYVDGILEVTPRPISIKPCDISAIYDGEYHGPTDFEYIDPNITLFDGESFVLSYGESYKYAGTYKSRIESYKILRNNEEDITKNYDITLVEGIIEILVRTIKVKPEYVEVEYDNEYHQASKFEYLEGSLELISDDGITFIYNEGYRDCPGGVSQITEIDFQNEEARNSYEFILQTNEIKMTPRAISIKPCDISVIYDGEYHGPADFEYIEPNITLFDGESFVLSYSEPYKYAGTYKSRIESYKILRNNEEDITKNYDVTVSEGDIEILVRPVSVKPKDIEAIYDHELHQASSFEYLEGSYELIPNDGITFIYSDGYINVGDYESSIVKINFQNEDARNSYEFTTLTGSIKILKRDIKVKPEDLEITYDSFDHVSNEAVIENINDHELLRKIKVSIKTDGIVNEYTEVPVINSITNCVIYYAEEEITDNFNIILNTGTLNVLKRPLKLIAKSASKVYDNKALTLNEYSLEGEIASNDEISTIVIEGEILDVGKVENTIKEFRIIRSNTSHEVTPSYDITYVDGILEVTPRPISIKPCDISAIYDGEYHGPTDFEYIDPNITLFDGESFVLSYGEAHKYAGTYKSTITSALVFRKSTNQDITNNYDITLIEGIIEILVRTIKVKPEYVEVEYDNEYHQASKFEYLEGSYKLIQTDGITFIYNEGYRDCPGGESQIIEIRFQNEEARNSYEFLLQTNEIKITPRAISIKPCDISVIYDGEYHSPNDFEYIDPNITLFDDESFVLSYSETHKYAGTYKSRIESYKILRNNEEDITNNYDVTLSEGIIEILVRPISIKPKDIEAIYDHELHQASSFEYLEGSYELIQNDGITIIYSDGYINVGDYESSIVKINFQNEDARNSYEFTTLPGRLVIKAREIKIVLEDATKVYDGIIFTSNKYHLDNNYYDICVGQSLSFDTYTILDGVKVDALDVNIYTNAVENIMITSDDGDVTSNYKIYVETGKLEITKREIKIETESHQKVYDDILELYPNSVVTSIYDKAIVDGEVLHLEYESFRDVGRYQNIPTTIQILRDNIDISSLDYDITWVYGEIEIVARIVEITTNSKSWSYDALSHTFKEFKDSNLVSGHEISGTLFASIKHCGTVDNSFTPIVLSDHGDVTKNYEFSWNYGTLEITGISIEVTTENITKEYDGTPLKSSLQQPNITGNLQGEDTASIKEETKSSITYYQDGGINNLYEIYISNSDGEDLIGLGDYIVTYNYGKLEITKREIKVSPGNIEKEYNGFEQMVDDLIVISDKKLAAEDAFKDVITSNKKTYVSQNDEENINEIVSFKIYANNLDITDSYDVSLEVGTFKIVPRELVIKTGSSSKPYDGLPLTNENYDIIEGLVSNDYIIGRTTGYIVEPGSVVNSFVFNAYNQNDDDITSSYALSDKQFGNLEITTIDEDYVLFKIKTSIDDIVYLKANSYGDYQGSDHFLPQKNYTSFDEDKFVALALKDNQYNLQTLEYVDKAYGLIPYYTLSNNQNVYSYYSYDYIMNPNILGSTYKEIEESYRSFVYENYLQIDDETSSFMNTIQEKYKLTDLSTYEKIARVKEIVSTKVPYNLNYDANFNDENVNTAIYFFDGAKSAVCRHYATAATMLLRSMGIPARYTTGYMVNTIENTETDVYASFGHAWVEVYIDNLGWINLEVTGSSSNPPIVVPEPSLDDLIRIELTNLSFEYDGKYHGRSATDFKLDSISSEKYYITLDGPFNTYLNIGKYSDKISLSQVHVYDKETNEEVTASVKERIAIYGGQVTITPRKLEITSGSASKNYDGEELRCEEYTENGLLPGHELKITFTGSQIEPGRSENTFLYEILDSEGNDVSSFYNVTCKYGTLVVYKEIVVETGTKEEEYQGQTIYTDEYELVDSKLLDGDHIEVINDSLTILNEYGKIDNIFEIRILDKDGNDVTGTYKINYKYGYLKLYKTIVLESASAKKEYDGTPLTCHLLLSEPELLPSHSLNLIFTGEITNCGKVDNDFEYQILDDDGKDVTDIYYNVQIKLGKLEISKYKITLTSGSATKEYDGEELVCNTGSYRLEVALGFKIIVDYGTTSKLILPGETPNEFEPSIYDEFGNDITDYFEITKMLGTLTITHTKEEVIVKASNSSKTYTGQAININKLYKISGADLSDYQYDVTVSSNKDPVEIGTYKLTPEIKIYKSIDGENIDVTNTLFTITVIEGTLTINQIKLTITTNSLKMAYSGSEVAKELYQGYSINGKILLEHTLDITWSDITVLEYGTYKNSASFKILDAQGNDVTKYYNITILFGTIEITK